MKFKVSELKQYITFLLREAAYAPEQGASAGFSLFVVHDSQGIIWFSLVDTNKILQSVNSSDSNKILSVKDGAKFIHDLLSQNTIASSTLQFSGACEAWEVTSIAAEKNWGPTMYDIMLSYVNETAHPWIVPDRDKVTPAASRVWKQYYYNRSDEVQHEPVSDACYSANHPDYLNVKYKLFFQGLHLSLEKNADDLKRAFRKLLLISLKGINRKVIDDVVSKIVSNANFTYFGEKYTREISPELYQKN